MLSEDQVSPTHGLYFHVYNRGVGGSRIFFNSRNYDYCLRLANRYAERYDISVLAYCLMPNHYHFLLRQDGNQFPSKLIGTVFNAYVQAVNKEQRRRGTLFEGRSKNILVDREEYLVHICRYIHLNPVRVGLVDEPEDWPYSNYNEWVAPYDESVSKVSFIQDHFRSASDYKKFVDEYKIGIDDREINKYLVD